MQVKIPPYPNPVKHTVHNAAYCVPMPWFQGSRAQFDRKAIQEMIATWLSDAGFFGPEDGIVFSWNHVGDNGDLVLTVVKHDVHA